MNDWINFLEIILDIFDVKYIIDEWYNCSNKFYEHISDESLIKVLIEFGDEAFTKNCSKLYPDYDRLEEFISNEIEVKNDSQQFPPIFSWLSDEEKVKATKKMKENPLPNIKTEITFL